MSDYVLSDKNVVARKAHRCAHCGTNIAVGTRHRATVQIYDGQFDSLRAHDECEAAFVDLNIRLRGLRYDDDLLFLIDDGEIEDGEKDWLREKHPIVADRLWPAPVWTAVKACGVPLRKGST